MCRGKANFLNVNTGGTYLRLKVPGALRPRGVKGSHWLFRLAGVVVTCSFGMTIFFIGFLKKDSVISCLVSTLTGLDMEQNSLCPKEQSSLEAC